MNDIQDKEDEDSEAQIMEDTKNFSKPKYVNSTAVVKYSAVQTPANFARLQCNTDLNLPPSNWLSSSANSYGLQHVLSHSTGFSSFRMAHMFPDCVGEVDVVSDAENIKTLLKIPYSRGPVSMMVHRIENTLLIDDFDIHKYLLRRAETEWDWLKKFFFEHIQKALNDKDKTLPVKSKTRNALQQKSLMSKFLYHSLVETDNDAQSVTEEAERIDDLPTSGPALPEPNVEEEVPDPNTDHTFNRNVLWTFENIQMLIGTDMPIFGGSTHPCISLRLSDMKKPISVLTGIDYWLDNLMSNVPEVVMCYHLNGIVQKYEFIKTEDLPHLENSKFSPKLIRDIAQNILSFLKSNATKAGHTYWLFKGKNDDFVKLYDLSSLCSGVLDEKGQNPFTVPVAMLLYRVARNMKNTSDGEMQAGTIRMLLKNCIDLLPKEKYPQIVTSSHYMLSDLYIPANTNPNSPGLDSNPSDEENIDSLIQNHNDIAIMNLNQANESDNENHEYRAPPPILGTVIERCQMALHHVAAGLNCLDFFPSNDSNDQTNTDEPVRKKTDEDNLKMSNPFEAIPMPYSQLNKNVKEEDKSKKSRKRNRNKKVQKKSEIVEDDAPKALLPKQKAEAMPTWQEPDRSDNASWKVHLKTLLFEKACLVYATLAEQEYLLENYGNSLRYIEALVKCQKIVKNANYTCQHVLESCLLGRAGDCFCMIEKHWSEIHKYRREYEFATDIDREIMEEINKYYPTDSSSHEMWDDILPKSIDDNEQLLLLSCKCYEQALASEPVTECKNLMRRLGNVQNELGTLYMNKAAMTFNEDLKTTGLQDIVVYQTLLTKAAQYLEAGIRSFETVHDEANLSLLYSNMGRLMRTNAHICAPDAVEKQSELAGQEKHYYQKALSNYQQALAVLGNRQRNPDIWDAVMWELSTALYTMATLMQDYPNMRTRSQQDLERDVSEMLHKALRYCDMETPGARQPIYQYRGAKIHHRLASLYHKTLRERYEDDTRTKNLVQICKLHYEQATKLMLLLEEAYEYLRIMLEYIALYELLFDVSSGVSKKHKYLLTALYLLFNTKAMLKYISEHESSDDNSENCKQTKGILANKSTENSENETCDKNSNKKSEETEQSTDVGQINEKRLISLVEQRLQFILLNLTKLFAKSIKSTNKEDENLGQVYKSMYSLSLRTKNQLQGVDLALHLYKLLIRLSDIVSNSIPKDLMQKIINNLIQN